jgi:hypothetical protein
MWTYQFDKWDLLGSVQSKDLIILFDENNIVRAGVELGVNKCNDNSLMSLAINKIVTFLLLRS